MVGSLEILVAIVGMLASIVTIISNRGEIKKLFKPRKKLRKKLFQPQLLEIKKDKDDTEEAKVKNDAKSQIILYTFII